MLLSIRVDKRSSFNRLKGLQQSASWQFAASMMNQPVSTKNQQQIFVLVQYY